MKKRLISLMLIICLVMSMLITAVVSAASSTGKVIADIPLNVRSGPGTNYKIVGKLKLNDKVTIIEERSGWYKIGESRWVISQWVVKEVLSCSDNVFDAHVIADIPLNIRSGPGTNYTIVGKLKLNDNVTVSGENNGWYMIGKDRWVTSQWIARGSVNVVKPISFEAHVIADIPLNIRSGPGTNYASVGKLKLNDNVTVIGEQSGWYRIGESRWVIAEWIAKGSANIVKPISFNGYVTADIPLNIRSGPGINYASVGKLKLNDKVTIIGEQSGWYKIGENRWVTAEWISKDQAIVSKHSHPLSMIFLADRYYKKCVVCGYLEDASGNPVTIGNKSGYPYFIDYTSATGKAINLGAKYPGVGKETSEGFKFNYEVILNGAQLGLELGGLIPVIGEPLDGINAAIYLIRKDYENAALSSLSIVPVVGYIGTTGKVYKVANKSIKVIKITDKLTDFIDVTKYIKKFGKLPDNYVTKQIAENVGWSTKSGNLANVLPGKSIGGDIFNNIADKVTGKKLLPDASGRIWKEVDINYTSGHRNSDRLLYSNDGLFYKTIDHYKTATKIE